MRILAWPAFKNQRQNPYNSLLYSNLQELDPLVEVYEYSTKSLLLKQFNIWHFHWPENIFRQPLLTLLRRLLAFIWKVWFAKLRGVRLVWTVHNLQSHESLHPRWEKKFKRWLIGKLDGIIFLTENAHELLLSRHPEAASIPAKVIPHGHYMSSYKNTMNPHAARANLGFDEEPTILLFIGQVRRYKNVLHLIQVFKQITFDHTVTLIVAGSPGNDEALRSELEEAARGIPSIRLDLRFIPDDEVQTYLNAANIVILPYQEILNSGSAILALSFLKPVLVPEKGAMSELRQCFGQDWVHTFQNELSSDTLCSVLNQTRSGVADPAELRKVLQRELGWSKIACETLAFYEEVITTARNRLR